MKKQTKTQPTEFQLRIREKFTFERIAELLDEGMEAVAPKYFQGQCVGNEPAYMVRLAYMKAAIELAGFATFAPESLTPENDERLTKALGNLGNPVN